MCIQGEKVPNIRTLVIIIVLFLSMTFNAFDLKVDLATNESMWHILQELFVIILSVSLIVFLTVELKHKKRDMQALKEELKTTERSLTKSTTFIQNARKEYSEIIHQQFDEWQLSQSQQQIALLLLKGLSFNEIAAIRDTKEKTVRQQASEIYKKSDVAGRHAFSAWFFEDFLN
jgi:DNA-binding CsgD family transcriptional regulator